MTLEELLNKLIEKGWKPFGESRIEEINRAEQYAGNWNWCCWGGAMQRRKSTRQIASKESGLWQFVCENGMVNKKICYCTIRTDVYVLHEYYDYNYEYRLIESALKDESELEEFLLQSIVINND